ncbi:MAG: DUF721 domain-containing protein [Leptospira sp.]|nr:DUF721 domain-containing protein [Leptospira sp.]
MAFVKTRITDFKDVFQQQNVSEGEVLSAYIFEKIVRHWKNVIGPLFYPHIQPKKYAKETLYVIVDHSVYKQELGFIKAKIIQDLNYFLNRQIIRNIIVDVGKISYSTGYAMETDISQSSTNSQVNPASSVSEESLFEQKITSLFDRLNRA